MTREAVAQRQPDAQSTAATPSGLLQRKCACGQHTGGGQCAPGSKKKGRLQRRHGREGTEFLGAPSIAHGELRTSTEPSIGHEFSQVRTQMNAKEDASRAVPLGLLRLQPKLRVGAPNDVLEREADRVAKAVMRMPDPALEISGGERHTVQRMCGSCKHEADAALQSSSLRPLNGSASPLPEPASAFFEHRMVDNKRSATCAKPDGTLHGSTMTWHANGSKAVVGSYREGKKEGEWTYWHDNGRMSGRGRFQADQPTGRWVTWHDNGQSESEGSYLEGRHHGPFTHWDRGGRIEKVLHYEHGALTKTVHYRDGKPIG